jgi:hypothetical protein
MKTLHRRNRSLCLLSLSLALILLSLPAQGAVTSDDGPLNVGDVLLGPCGVPGAMGPEGINDDFTNRSISTGIASDGPGGVTTAPISIVFRNTLQNTGAGDDFFVLSAPATTAGFAIEMSIDDGDHYITLKTSHPSITLPVAYRAAAIILVRINAPAGLKLLTGFDTVIRATSTATPTATNDTIDRLYTGFIRIDRTATVIKPNLSAAGMASGPEIEFAVTYANVSSAAGVGNSLLTAHNLVISENGNSASNNWGATTEHIVGATDTQGGVILGDRAGSTWLTDILTTLEAGQKGVFKFKRRVK